MQHAQPASAPLGSRCSSRLTHWLLPLAILPSLIGCVTPLTGCAYRSGGLYPEGIRTVAVPVFENRTFYVEQRIEAELTEALVKAIELRTPYKVTDASVADTELRGVVTRVEQRQRLRQPRTGLPREIEITVSVDARWVDLRSGETLLEIYGLEGVGRYLPGLEIRQSFENAQHEAVERLVRLILSRMEANW